MTTGPNGQVTKMIRQKTETARYFFYSRHVSDALLITAGILIPAVAFAHYELFEMGVIVSLGALCVGVTDSPGPFREKIVGMAWCNAFIFIVAMVTGYAGASVYFESIEIILLCFFFSMFTLYGSRAASIGTTSLMVMITMMYRHKEASGIPEYAGLLLSGGLWYMLLSILFYKLMPYRQVQQVLGECILETTKSLKLKARLYNLHVDQSDGLNALILEQIRLNEKQEDARQLLFTNPLIVHQPTEKGKILTATFLELMDVYEQIVSTSYYETIRTKFGRTEILPLIENLLNTMSKNLKYIGYAIQSNSRKVKWLDTDEDFIKLKRTIDLIAERNSESTFILKKALITFRTMNQRIQNMEGYLTAPDSIVTDHTAIFRFDLFLTPKAFTLNLLKDNFSFQSSTFRYALRVTLVAFIGFVVANMLAESGHSYWILFTVVFIMKPAFSLSKERNYQRMGGTLIGGLISFPIMLYIHNNTVLFILLMSFMIVAYSFMRINYLVFVVFMTSYVLLMFKLLGTGSVNIVGERVIDTLIGASMAFAAIYFIFPNWEFKQIRVYIGEMLRANRDYLNVLKNYFSGSEIEMNDYKLARKETYNDFANLAGSFQRMNSEPKTKRRNIDEIQRFIISNHQLSSLIGSNTAAVFTGKLSVFRNSAHNLRYIEESLSLLDESLRLIDSPTNSRDDLMEGKISGDSANHEDHLVKSQFKLILERCESIRETTRVIFNSELGSKP